jgi:hypothetical protein
MAGIDANTLLMLHCDGSDDGTTFTDSSSYSRSATKVGTPVTKTGTKKFGTASIYCATKDSYVTFPDSADFAFGTNPFTIDTWVYTTDASKHVLIYGQRESAYKYIDIEARADTRKVEILVYTAVGTYLQITTPFTISVSTWYHIAIVRVNSDNAATAWRIFIDGDQKSLTLVHGNWNDSIPDYAANIVAPGATLGGPSLAYYDEYRISNVARWTSSFTPPTSAYSTDGGFMTTNKGWL